MFSPSLSISCCSLDHMHTLNTTWQATQNSCCVFVAAKLLPALCLFKRKMEFSLCHWVSYSFVSVALSLLPILYSTLEFANFLFPYCRFVYNLNISHCITFLSLSVLSLLLASFYYIHLFHFHSSVNQSTYLIEKLTKRSQTEKKRTDLRLRVN